MNEIDCRTCKYYLEQPSEDFCWFKGHKIRYLDRYSCKGYEPREPRKETSKEESHQQE